MTYKEFQESSLKSKPLTSQQLLARQLMVVRGMSMDKANGIVSEYPTFGCLMAAYGNLNCENDRRKLLSDLTFGSDEKKIGASISNAVAQFFEPF